MWTVTKPAVWGEVPHVGPAVESGGNQANQAEETLRSLTKGLGYNDLVTSSFCLYVGARQVI